jgi:kynureninase
MNFENSLAFAQQLDEEDVLRSFRNEFVIPQHKGKDAVYFLGNSLGLRPKKAVAAITNVIHQWDEAGVESFFKGDDPWLAYHDKLIRPLANIVGALPQEVVVMNSLTVNLHLMLASFYQPQGKRKKILCEAKAFCSDQYMLETHVKQRGLIPGEIIIEVHPRENEFTIREEDILAAIEQHKEELALVFFGGVNYYTGQVLNMKGIAAAAREAGAKIGFDLAHAAGNVALHLHEWGVDFACWCSYKYLNSGPGGIGGAYVHEKYHNDLSINRFAGWWGYRIEDRFKMKKGFDPVRSAGGWSLSTPSPILYAAHKAALDVFEEAGMDVLEKKGRLLSDYLLYVLNAINSSFSAARLRVLTPADAKGCQVSLLMLQNGKDIFNHLSEQGVFADWREPDVIRVAPVPLYNTFEEVWQFSRLLQKACTQ